MSRIGPVSLAVKTLRGVKMPRRLTISRDWALAILRAATEQDFGDDITAWNDWLRQNRWAYSSRRAYDNLAKNMAQDIATGDGS